MREELVENAIRFLNNEASKERGFYNQLKFLESKGLTSQEIDYAFNQSLSVGWYPLAVAFIVGGSYFTLNYLKRIYDEYVLNNKVRDALDGLKREIEQLDPVSIEKLRKEIQDLTQSIKAKEKIEIPKWQLENQTNAANQRNSTDSGNQTEYLH